MHSRFHSSAFRNRIQKDPNILDVEDPLKDSGLLGKDPSKRTLIRSATPQIALTQTIQDNKKITKPKMRSQTAAAQVATQKPDPTPRRLQTPVDLDKETKIINVPNVFFGKILPLNEPPSESNFIQLDEVLDRLVNSGVVNIMSAHNKVFGDVISQYLIECSAQGQLLNRCKEFFSHTQKRLPVFRNILFERVDDIQKKTCNLIELSKRIEIEIESEVKPIEYIKDAIKASNEEISVKKHHYDEILKQVDIASKDAQEIKEEVAQLDSRIAEKNRKLMDLNNELRTLDLLSTNYTSDTLRFAESLKQIRNEHLQTEMLIDETNEEMVNSKSKISRLDAEIAELTDLIEKSRIVKEKSEIEIQCDLFPRRLFKEKKEAPKNEDIIPRSVAVLGDLFKGIIASYQQITGKKTSSSGIVVNSYDDMSKLKKLVFENENKFRMDDNEIKVGQNGEYFVKPETLDYTRLYSSFLMSNCLSRVVKLPAYDSKPCQTYVFQQKIEQKIEEEATDDLRKTAFMALLKTDYHTRPPKRLDWLVEQIHQIYDSKNIENQRLIEEHKPITPLSKFIYEYGRQKMKLDFLTDQYGWDLYITTHEHADRAHEVEIFATFLDEKYNEEQLAFFLRARTYCIKIGCSIFIKTRDQLETLNEYYLSNDQTEKALKRWWSNRYRHSIYTSILEMSISRPSIHLESNKRYIAMHDILQICIQEYHNDTVARLNEQLMLYRIVPRLKSDEFNALLYSLIPDLEQHQVDEFYRATVTKAKQREEIDTDEFIDIFRENCLLYHQELDVVNNGIESFEFDKTHNCVEDHWFKSKADITRIIEFFNNQLALQPDNTSLKTYLDEAKRYQSMLSHSLTTHDGSASSQHYFSLLLTLDVMYSTIGYLNADIFKPSLLSAECAIREQWLDNIFLS